MLISAAVIVLSVVGFFAALTTSGAIQPFQIQVQIPNDYGGASFAMGILVQAIMYGILVSVAFVFGYIGTKLVNG